MHGGGNRIYGLHVIIHNGLFAQCEVLDNFRRLCDPKTKTRTWGPRTRTRACKLVLEDPQRQGLSSRTTTLKTSTGMHNFFRLLREGTSLLLPLLSDVIHQIIFTTALKINITRCQQCTINNHNIQFACNVWHYKNLFWLIDWLIER